MRALTDKIKKYSIAQWIMIICIFIQMAFIVYTNLFRIPVTLDNDAAKSMVHGIEIWNQKTLFLRGWSQMTTLETGTPTFFAVFIYGLCKNIYVSYSISNFIILAIYVYCVVYLANRLGVSNYGKLVSVALLMIPYSFGQLLYYNMMFFAAGAYSIRIIIPILMVLLLTDDKADKKHFIVLTVLTALLVFLCSISTGYYVFITALFPTLVVYIWMDILKRENIKSSILCRKNISSVVICISGFVGLAIYYIKDISSAGLDLDYAVNNNSWTYFADIFSSWFEIFGAYPYESVSVMSLSGMTHALRFVLASIFLMVFIGYCISAVKALLPILDKNDAKICDEADADKNMIIPMFFMIIIVDFFTCVVTASGNQCRYMLMAAVPVFLFMGCFITDMEQSDRFTCMQHKLMRLCFGALVFGTLILSDYACLKGDCFPIQKNDNEKLNVLIDKLGEYSQKQIYFLDDTGSTENIRLMDYGSDKIYASYMTKEDLDFWNIRGVNVHDYYLGITDAANMDDDNIMIVNTYLSSMDNAPDYIKNTYSLVDEYQNYLIYVSDTNRLDGVTGYVDNEKSKDYCYSYGYELAGGEMNSEGGFEVIGSDDYVLSSPRYGEAQGELTLSMNYETDSSTESVGRLEVIDCNSGEVICDENIVSNANQLIIDGVDLSGRNIALKVYMNANEPITIYSFEFDRGIND